MWLLPLPLRPVVGSLSVTRVGFGLLSRQDVQAEEKAPQNHSGRRRMHVVRRNPAEIKQQCREAGHQQGTTTDQKTTVEMGLPAWQQLRAEVRPSGGETLRSLGF